MVCLMSDCLKVLGLPHGCLIKTSVHGWGVLACQYLHYRDTVWFCSIHLCWSKSTYRARRFFGDGCSGAWCDGPGRWGAILARFSSIQQLHWCHSHPSHQNCIQYWKIRSQQVLQTLCLISRPAPLLSLSTICLYLFFKAFIFFLYCATVHWYPRFASSSAILMNTTSLRTAAWSCCWISHSLQITRNVLSHFRSIRFLLRQFFALQNWFLRNCFEGMLVRSRFWFQTSFKTFWNWFQCACECANPVLCGHVKGPLSWDDQT